MKEYIERAAAIEAAYQGLKRPSNIEEWKRICEQLQNVPAADVVEVRHGRWINGHEGRYSATGDVWRCSECGDPCLRAFGKPARTTYCPNCGAKMDGGVNDV